MQDGGYMTEPQTDAGQTDATPTDMTTESFAVINASAGSGVVLVCEHASAAIPDALDNLGLAATDLLSHAVWDPGALAVAKGLARRLDAVLVAGSVSRLVVDLNRASDAPDVMPARTERIPVPGNAGLDAAAISERMARYHAPFHDALDHVLNERQNPVLVTIHSFTPVWNGTSRDVEIGVLHDSDTRLADALLRLAPDHMPHEVQRNQPYGPGDGVTHTLCAHALPQGRANVMLEIRNDLIATPAQQAGMTETLARWIGAALAGGTP